MSETLERTWQNNPFPHSIGLCCVDIWMFWKAGPNFSRWMSSLSWNNASKSCFAMLPSWRCLSLDVARRSETTFLIEQTSGEFQYSCLLFTALHLKLSKTYIKYSSEIHPTKRSKIHPNLFRFASSRIGCSLSTPRSSGSSPYHRYRLVVEYHERQVRRNTIAPSVWRLGARTGQEASRVVEEGRVGWWWQHPTSNVMMTTSQRLKASHQTAHQHTGTSTNQVLTMRLSSRLSLLFSFLLNAHDAS